MVQLTIFPISWICAYIKIENIRLGPLSFSHTQRHKRKTNRMMLPYITWRMKPVCNVGVHCDPFKRRWTIFVLRLFILYCQHLPLLLKHNTSFKWLFWWLTSGPLFIFNIHLQLKKFGHKSEVSLDVAVGRWFQLQLPFLLFLTCIDVNLIKEEHKSNMKTHTDVNSHTSAIAMLLHVPHAALLVAFINLIPYHLQLFETPLRQRCSTDLQDRYK